MQRVEINRGISKITDDTTFNNKDFIPSMIVFRDTFICAKHIELNHGMNIMNNLARFHTQRFYI